MPFSADLESSGTKKEIMNELKRMNLKSRILTLEIIILRNILRNSMKIKYINSFMAINSAEYSTYRHNGYLNGVGKFDFVFFPSLLFKICDLMWQCIQWNYFPVSR